MRTPKSRSPTPLTLFTQIRKLGFKNVRRREAVQAFNKSDKKTVAKAQEKNITVCVCEKLFPEDTELETPTQNINTNGFKKFIANPFIKSTKGDLLDEDKSNSDDFICGFFKMVMIPKTMSKIPPAIPISLW